jgi:uncharacterized cupin superfamily protein
MGDVTRSNPAEAPTLVPGEGWQTGWTPEVPPEIGYVSVPADSGAWLSGLWPGYEYRDLGLAGVSKGVFGAAHVRTAAGVSATGRHCHDADFEFFYVLQGSLTIETEAGERVTLGPGATGCHPRLYGHDEVEASDDLEYVRITSPAEPRTLAGRGKSSAGESKAVYTHDTPDSYVVGNGPRKFFRYRDLGTRDFTDGRIHIHVVRAGAPAAGTGWHYHSMAQWFMILGGSSVIRVEDQSKVTLGPVDAMCLGRGPHMRHNVAPFSGDYAVLEMCVPSEYETVAVPPPENADSPPEGALE